MSCSQGCALPRRRGEVRDGGAVQLRLGAAQARRATQPAAAGAISTTPPPVYLNYYSLYTPNRYGCIGGEGWLEYGCAAGRATGSHLALELIVGGPRYSGEHSRGRYLAI
jgi:hypothetical protein